eukprot:TRINITY_DN94182_c0_g1_i1.p1 TRINITY_DN94182_c0_g1~~TRINITY_DN94182_c0_g1_i1.p1  ORF type:complete len:592 (-),score=114.79 TRINITY_DN94182_c0_g1_i1:23-1573(-)
MRLYGFAADQLLQIEMVLADGSHVRFAPSEWEDVTGKLYPQTTKVEGECNRNISADESEWDWQPCDDISFQDLWSAVRGGGGGTYGVVTSVFYQLHDQELPESFENVFKVPAAVSCSSPDSTDYLRTLWLNFSIDFFFPQGGEDWENVSNFCGSPSAAALDIFGQGFYSCNDNTTAAVMRDVWVKYVDSAFTTLLAMGCRLQDVILLRFMLIPLGAVTNYFTAAMLLPLYPVWMRQNPSRLPDNPPPATLPDNLIGRSWTAFLPKTWLHGPDALQVLLAFVKGGNGASTYILGGETERSGDGMSSVPEAQRKAGFLVYIPEDFEDLFRSSMEEFMGKNSFQNVAFPGGTGYNHISASEMGPLKANWSKACPSSLTVLQRRQQCVPALEAVWGTDLLTKLERIKDRVDPESLFQCFRCVGFKGFKDSTVHGGYGGNLDSGFKDQQINQQIGSFKDSGYWCINSGYDGACFDWLHSDPADDVESLRLRVKALQAQAKEMGALAEYIPSENVSAAASRV